MPGRNYNLIGVIYVTVLSFHAEYYIRVKRKEYTEITKIKQTGVNGLFNKQKISGEIVKDVFCDTEKELARLDLTCSSGIFTFVLRAFTVKQIPPLREALSFPVINYIIYCHDKSRVLS